MDPTNPESFNHRIELLSTGRKYHFVDQKPEGYGASTTTLLLVHGWPDTWYVNSLSIESLQGSNMFMTLHSVLPGMAGDT